MAMSRKLFVNLGVSDLKKSMAFFTTLGFTFNRQFTDDNAACMVISEEAYVMLLTPPFFRQFTRREPCNTTTHTEGLFALSCESREEVDGLVGAAVAAGGSTYSDPQDHGFMYGHGFQDPDGHVWELMWMDPSFVQPT